MNLVAGLDHVQIAIPAGGEEKARDYFGGMLGLVEIPKLGDMARRGGCWFDLGKQQLHVGVDKHFKPALKAHIALKTDALDKLRTRVELAGFETFDDMDVEGRRRFFSNDPFGNRIEFIDETSST